MMQVKATRIDLTDTLSGPDTRDHQHLSPRSSPPSRSTMLPVGYSNDHVYRMSLSSPQASIGEILRDPYTDF